MLFGKNKIKFGQNFFASPKICTPVHVWTYVLEFLRYLMIDITPNGVALLCFQNI